ncbi:MAG: putative toxin-antitoxin system toxin component, PIN family [Bacteroidales bacterium]|nr:putative toxin-antitoxin system toxin component, PIN family [Bacteroidales bacterium]
MDHIVLDTNVLIMSISARNQYQVVWQKFISNAYMLCITNEILEEYSEVIARNINPKVADAVVNTILTRGNVLRIDPHMHYNLITADPDDNKFVDCALFANAKYIVSEDRHFDVLKNIPFPHVDVIGIDSFVLYINQ